MGKDTINLDESCLSAKEFLPLWEINDRYGYKELQEIGIARRIARVRFVLFGGVGERDACRGARVGRGMDAARDVVFFACRVGGVLVVGFGDAPVPVYGGRVDAFRLEPLPRDGGQGGGVSAYL